MEFMVLRFTVKKKNDEYNSKLKSEMKNMR